jgi:hypothetical protein
VYEIEHYIHRNHLSLARESGLHLFEYRNGVIGPSVHDFYRDGIGDKAYARDFGLNLVAAYLFRKRLWMKLQYRRQPQQCRDIRLIME